MSSKSVLQVCHVRASCKSVSLAEKLRFWASKLHFWRKSRRNAGFLILKASFLKEVSQKCFVFHLESFHFEGSLAKKLRFWVAKLHFWRKSRRKASFLSFKASFYAWLLILKASFLKEVSQKCLVFDLQSFVFEGSLAEKLRLTKSFESHISWQPNHLNLKSFDIQITWSSDQVTTESLESQINWQPKSFESQIRWQPNHLTLNSFESDINWLSNQLNSARSLPIGSLSLETSATALCGRYVIILKHGTGKLCVVLRSNCYATLAAQPNGLGAGAGRETNRKDRCQ